MSDVRSRPTSGSTRLLLGGTAAIVVVLAASAIARLRDVSSGVVRPPAAIGVEVSQSGPIGSEAPHVTSGPVGEPSSAVEAAPPVVESLPIAERIVGTWALSRHGERVLTIRPDGTATADVRLDLLGAVLYGAHLRLELTWQVAGDVMSQTIRSGTPNDAVSRLIRDWGDQREYRILEVTTDRVVMAEVGDEDDRQVWTSVTEPMSAAKPGSVSSSRVNDQSPR